LREDVIERDDGILPYLEDQQGQQQQRRMIDRHFIVPKLKTDGGFV
jgi:hypothetical protein